MTTREKVLVLRDALVIVVLVWVVVVLASLTYQP